MTDEKKKKVVIICGPTAVGKTAVGIELAKKFDGEVVSADSQQVWRGFDIGTAKATIREMSEIPHYLVDILNPDEQFDASKFVSLADKAVDEIINKKKNVFMVGGTGLYIRAFLHGLCDAPQRDEKFRKKLEGVIEQKGVVALHEMLTEVDPEGGMTIHPNDRTRLIRALEIHHLTSKSSSEFIRLHQFRQTRYDALKIGLNIDRKELYRRIDERVDRMIEKGLVDEVRGLLKMWNDKSQPFMAVGYREIVSYLMGKIDFDKAIELTKQNSRNYAKRQLTWFRADKSIKWFSPDQIGDISKEVEEFYKV